MLEPGTGFSNDACSPTLDFSRITFRVRSAKPRRLFELIFAVLLCEFVRFQAEEEDDRFRRPGTAILHRTLSSNSLQGVVVACVCSLSYCIW
jgi:hypothetical protein